MLKKWSIAIAMVLIAGTAFGQSRRAVIEQAEMSMLVTGAIGIDATGKPERVTIDKPEALPPGVVKMVEQASAGWAFEPVTRDGKAVRAKGPMTLRMVAKKLDDDHFSMQIRSATFGSEQGRADEFVRSVQRAPPRYPAEALRKGVSGTVYLIVRVGRDGKAQEVAAEQTNLRVAASENEMKQLRGIFERASIDAARRWTFAPPSAGKEAAADHWVIRFPIDYRGGMRPQKNAYGMWEAYVPGPRAIIPWASEDETLAGVDALGDGGLYQLGSGPKLLTPLGPG